MILGYFAADWTPGTPDWDSPDRDRCTRTAEQASDVANHIAQTGGNSVYVRRHERRRRQRDLSQFGPQRRLYDRMLAARCAHLPAVGRGIGKENDFGGKRNLVCVAHTDWRGKRLKDRIKESARLTGRFDSTANAPKKQRHFQRSVVPAGALRSVA